MAAGIGAAGILGIAREATAGTYVAPAKFIPIRSESLKFAQETVFTRPIRGVADIVHAVAGNATVEGDIEFEVTHDNLPWFLYAMRGDVVVTGAAPPYVYTFTPSSIGQKSVTKTTLSISIARNGVVFGYTQCVVGKMELTVDNGILVATMSILAKDEGSQGALTATWPTNPPFGAGQYTIEIPTATQVYDGTPSRSLWMMVQSMHTGCVITVEALSSQSSESVQLNCRSKETLRVVRIMTLSRL